MDEQRRHPDEEGLAARALEGLEALDESREQLQRALAGAEATTATALTVLEIEQVPALMLDMLTTRIDARRRDLAQARATLDRAFALLLDCSALQPAKAPQMIAAYRIANYHLDRSERALAQLRQQIDESSGEHA